MPQDFLLRLIDQVGLMLPELRRLKAGEKPARIGALCLRETGLPLDFVKHSSPETILQLLESGGGTQYARAVLLAELLLQDADVSDAAGRSREANISRAQAQALLDHSVDNLSLKNRRSIAPSLRR